MRQAAAAATVRKGAAPIRSSPLERMVRRHYPEKRCQEIRLNGENHFWIFLGDGSFHFFSSAKVY